MRPSTFWRRGVRGVLYLAILFRRRNCFYAWSSGVLDGMLDRLRVLVPRCAGRSAGPTAAIVDSQSVKTTQVGGPSGRDAAKRIKGRKRPTAVDTEGSPVVLRAHRADVQDRDGAPDVIVELLCKAPQVSKLFADGGYRRAWREGPVSRAGFTDIEGGGSRSSLSCAGVHDRVVPVPRRHRHRMTRYQDEIPFDGRGLPRGLPMSSK